MTDRFCGDWAGSVFNQSECAQCGLTCQGFVANFPSAFKEYYFAVRGLKVYKGHKDCETFSNEIS